MINKGLADSHRLFITMTCRQMCEETTLKNIVLEVTLGDMKRKSSL